MPSWTAIAERSLTHPGAVVELMRMPKKLQALQDMKTWRRSELDAFVTHILEGQKGRLPIPQQFQWREVPGKNGSVTRITASYETRPCVGSRIQYTRLENLYAQHVAVGSTTSLNQQIWKGLPLARTTHVYPAYSVELYSDLVRLHSQHTQMTQLIESVATLEQYGPVHVSPLQNTETVGSSLCSG